MQVRSQLNNNVFKIQQFFSSLRTHLLHIIFQSNISSLIHGITSPYITYSPYARTTPLSIFYPIALFNSSIGLLSLWMTSPTMTSEFRMLNH